MNTDDSKKPNPSTNREAAANIIRSTLEQIYASNDAPHNQAENEIRKQQEPQKRQPDHNDSPQPQLQTSEQWQKYHSSWTSYYQQYYERYYLNHLHRAKEQVKTDNQIHSPPTINQEDQAVAQLRDQLLGTVKDRAQQIKKSRHYAPILTALTFAFVFLFLQYNQFLFATVSAYISPGKIDPQNIILDPMGSPKVGPEPKLIIPKINVEAPVIYGTNPLNDQDVQNQLRAGVVHYPIGNATSVPGQNGATTILGHSSMDVFDDGKYKFVFVQLNKLNVGDNFYINYQGTRYTYNVIKKEIIDPTEIAKVTPGDASKPSVILITCEPPGTALKRLLVFADQVSPNPANAKAADTAKPSVSTQPIRGDAPSALERLFGAR